MIKRRRRWLFFLVCTTATLTLFYIMLSLKDNGILRNLVDETCRDGLAREMLFKLVSILEFSVVCLVVKAQSS